MDEWRTKKRFPMTAWVDVTVRESGAMRRGYVTNISREGIGLYYMGTVGPGIDIDLTMHMLGPTGTEIIEAMKGRVMWEDHWGGITIMGIKFDEPLGNGTPVIVERLSRAERMDGGRSPVAGVRGNNKHSWQIQEPQDPGEDTVPERRA